MSIALFALLAAVQAGPSATPPKGGAAPPMPAPIIVPPAPPPPRLPPTGPARAEPQAVLQSLATDGDYPPSALAQRQSGRVAFRLAIGADGRVAGCVILGSSGSSALDSATCRLMRSRARFTPARDHAGNPVPDEYFGQLAWRLPR